MQNRLYLSVVLLGLIFFSCISINAQEFSLDPFEFSNKKENKSNEYNYIIEKRKSFNKNLPFNEDLTKSKQITDIEVLNEVVYSPSNNSFICFHGGKDPSKYLYFFDPQGELIRNVEINMEPRLRYSQNGDFVIVFSRFEPRILLYDHNGVELKQFDLYELVNCSSCTLINTFISNDAQKMVLNTSDGLYSYSLNDNKKWSKKRKDLRIRNCYFEKDNNLILVESVNYELTKTSSLKYNLEMISNIDGTNLNEVKGLSWVFYEKGKLYFEIEQNIYEYEIVQ